MFDSYSVSPSDLPLLNKLGLAPFYDVPLYQRHCVGCVRVGDTGSVLIHVSGAPALFWEFAIKCEDGKRYEWTVSTGSGSLVNFWPAVEAMASGMFVVAGGEVAP